MSVVKTKRPLSAKKAETILSAALQEFSANGYTATTMAQIAAAAGVSKATLYTYFGDKENLFAALVKTMAQKKASIAFWKQSLQGDPRKILPVIISKGLDTFINDEISIAFKRLVIGESGRFPRLAQIFVCNMSKPSIEILSQYLASQDYLKFTDPEATARVVVGTMAYYAEIQEMLHGKEIIPMDKERLITILTQMVISSAESS
ncbi:TetR/AcrR family transcriptional regulator [Moorena producens]|uniref:TetR/AcrR family transcriptional regulator n=1 Tax=Moorena producens TaxID=1155739 RepID=UPI003C750A68